MSVNADDFKFLAACDCSVKERGKGNGKLTRREVFDAYRRHACQIVVAVAGLADAIDAADDDVGGERVPGAEGNCAGGIAGEGIIVRITGKKVLTRPTLECLKRQSDFDQWGLTR